MDHPRGELTDLAAVAPGTVEELARPWKWVDGHTARRAIACPR